MLSISGSAPLAIETERHSGGGAWGFATVEPTDPTPSGDWQAKQPVGPVVRRPLTGARASRGVPRPGAAARRGGADFGERATGPCCHIRAYEMVPARGTKDCLAILAMEREDS